MSKVRCSRCKQELDNVKSILDRHELGMHSKNRVIYSERDGSPSKPMGNHDYGPVTWIPLEEDGHE